MLETELTKTAYALELAESMDSPTSRKNAKEAKNDSSNHTVNRARPIGNKSNNRISNRAWNRARNEEAVRQVSRFGRLQRYFASQLLGFAIATASCFWWSSFCVAVKFAVKFGAEGFFGSA